MKKKPCPECGEMVEACPEPCGIWECAWSGHLASTCPSPAGIQRRTENAARKIRNAKRTVISGITECVQQGKFCTFYGVGENPTEPFINKLITISNAVEKEHDVYGKIYSILCEETIVDKIYKERGLVAVECKLIKHPAAAFIGSRANIIEKTDKAR